MLILASFDPCGKAAIIIATRDFDPSDVLPTLVECDSARSTRKSCSSQCWNEEVEKRVRVLLFSLRTVAHAHSSGGKVRARVTL